MRERRRRLGVLALGLGLGLPFGGVAWAADEIAVAPAPAEGIVSRVVIEGARRIEEASILPNISLRKGDVISAARIRRDLEQVYATGFFEDVRVEVLPDAVGVALVFTVTEKPAVRAINVGGNKKIDEDDIREAIDIRTFTVLNEADLQANVSRIRDLYVEKGYYLAEVNAEVVPVGDDQVELTFRMVEGRKVVVQRVDLLGNDHLAARKIKKYLQTKEGGLFPWLSSKGAFKEPSLDIDPQIIMQVYREEGYADVQVEPAKVFLTPDKRYVNVSYRINEGPKYTIGEVQVDGDFVPSEGLTEKIVLEVAQGRPVYDVQDEQWRTATGRPRLRLPPGRGPAVETGDTFKLSTVLGANGAIEDLYADQGYALVNVVPQPITHPDTKVVDILYQIETGPKMRVGRINITGNDPTFDKVVRREIVINEGEIYRGARLKASKARLERLGYFSKVEISTPRGEGDGVLDVNVQVEEQPTGTFSFGLGFSSLEQIVVSGNVSKNNFLGLGFNMAASINWSTLQQQFNLSFMDPRFLDTKWTLSFSAYSQTQQFVVNQYQRGGSLGVGRYLDRRDDVQLSLSYTIEDVGVSSIDAYKQRIMGGDLFRNGLTSTLSASLTADKRNSRMFATKGWFASAQVEMNGGVRIADDKLLTLLGGEFNFFQTQLNFRYYQPFFEEKLDRLVFRVNSSAGWQQSTDGRLIPFIHRFRAGGINSVRGYNWFSLGPTVRYGGSDDPIHADEPLIAGGTSIWVNNIEIESGLVPSAGIFGVVFFDAGNTFGDATGKGFINPLDMRASYGAGVRWRSPIGPLRFELGIPINPEPGWRTAVFDFGIGNFF